MSKLTAKAVENALPKAKEYKLSDGAGLYLRVRPSGAKSWLFCFRLQNDRRLIPMTLGNLSDMSLKNARAKLVELRKLVAEGIDPKTARAATKAENAQAITMQKLFDIWIEFEKLSGKVSKKWIKRHEDRWRLHLKKPLENLLAKDINRSHIASALDAMVRKSIKEETRKALTTLNLVLDYGLSRHYIDQNVARLFKPKDFGASANRPRTRALSLLELRQLWLALDCTSEKEPDSTNPIISTAIKLLILTGARRGEVTAMCWDELNLETGTWTLPPSRTKNHKSHTIYLSKLAIDLISSLQSVSGSSQFVFVITRNQEQGHIHEDTLTGALNRLRKSSDSLSKIELFTIHDLRRSAATAWGEYLKTPPHVIERMLNHQPLNKLVATYQRAIYADEQKAAWLAWGALVESQIANEYLNVFQIHNVANY